MRKLAVLTFLTLDGVMQAPLQPEEDTSNGFDHGGWAFSNFDQVMDQVNDEVMREPIDFLFGRKTYEVFAAFFPSAEGPNAAKFNTATKYVVTSTLSNLEWQNSIPISGDIAKEVSLLKEQDGPLLQVHGSSQLIQTLLAHNLVDEFRLWTFPVVVGPGKRLFDAGAVRENLTLRKTGSTQNGVVMSIYIRKDGH